MRTVPAGLRLEEEYITEDGLFSIDIALQPPLGAISIGDGTALRVGKSHRAYSSCECLEPHGQLLQQCAAYQNS